MQEIKDQKKSKFDYSLVSNEDADFLKQRINKIQNILQSDATKVGEQFYLAQQRLATYGHGTFGSWIESLKISKDSVYRYINRYSFIANCDNQSDIETFESLQKSLTYDVSKPSAPREAVQKVLDGDITTHKEYKELEKKLKQSEEANKTLDGLLSEKADTISALEQQVKNKPKPEVVEKTVTKEVKPDDYDELKRQASVADDLKKQREQSQSQINKLQKELNDLKSRSKYQKVIDTEEADRQHRLSVLKVETAISIYSLIRDIQDFLKKENVLRDISKVNGFDDESKNDLQEANDGLQRFVDEVNQILSGRKIVEGKFTE